MNKLGLFLTFLCLFGIALACESDYNPNLVTIGECKANDVAHWRETDSLPVVNPADLPAADRTVHEERMAYILSLARAQNKKFVASIYSPAGELLCVGINTGSPNIISHGEIVAINNCTTLHGIKSFTGHTLYTTGEPCAMCASALLWADFKTIVWGTFNSDLLCKICMSNIPMDSSYIFSRYYGLRPTAPVLIGGVLRADADAWFGTYCNRPTSIYYIKPQCACQNTSSPLNVTQTLVNTWIDGNQVQYSQFNAVIRNNANNVTVTNPTFKSLPSGVNPTQIWGLQKTSVADQWVLSWNPMLTPNQTFSFGYIIQGATELTFNAEAQH
ncbi:hypothetical protein CYY_006012 [Polysphondylium violaceum]|uniref:CMP/dCMP-type deaminase domain-containing protein n=1 Tax=Polysphondylium violaceum TaxID=133409 RepID=A0A8J4PR52_9MYCE|nr:hypothetical protein CYY_006012 [Polysphondylium violaceum]